MLKLINEERRRPDLAEDDLINGNTSRRRNVHKKKRGKWGGLIERNKQNEIKERGQT